MEIKYLAAIILGTVLVDNLVLARVFRTSPYPDRKFNFAAGMGAAVTVALVLTSLVTFGIYASVLAPLGAAYLAAAVFILAAVALLRAAAVSVRKILPDLHASAGLYLPRVTADCAVIGAAGIIISHGLFEPNAAGLLASVVRGFGAGAGFTLALVVMAGIRERFELADIPEYLRGAPVDCIAAGLLALAFFGFSGITI